MRVCIRCDDLYMYHRVIAFRGEVEGQCRGLAGKLHLDVEWQCWHGCPSRGHCKTSRPCMLQLCGAIPSSSQLFARNIKELQPDSSAFNPLHDAAE